MVARRAVLAGLLATGLSPQTSWADAGHPAYVTASLRPDGVYSLCGLDPSGHLTFEVALPDRGHAAAVHPSRPEAIAFARRPGTFAIVIDCSTGAQVARIEAPEGRHFYGHGVFSADGSRLFTTENDYDAARGMIGIWDAARGYRRIGEFASGGVGPHDILRLPGSGTLVVANGGIETHPDSGRAKLNLPIMRPNLSYLSSEGVLLDQFEPAPEDHLNSIRHLDVTPDGTVAFAMQWQGDPATAPALLGLHRQGEAAVLLAPDAARHGAMQGYAGSVSFSGDHRRVGITSPRGGLLQVFDVARGDFIESASSGDVCGLNQHPAGGFCFTNGSGTVGRFDGGAAVHNLTSHTRAFDNHLVRL
ncbi:DUF1513 domain-containing protein [Rhodobacteraceae bacterium M385]|nr:DUF1513 domain-containing protein [Rhodobacteraceae bacterium M385]